MKIVTSRCKTLVFLIIKIITSNMIVKEKDKILSVKEYLDMIRPYSSDMINDHKSKGECIPTVIM